MNKKYLRKHSTVFTDNGNEENIVKVNITIESNHVNNHLDTYLDVLCTNLKTLNNYSVKEKEVKEVKKKISKEDKLKLKKKKFFSSGDGQYV